LSSSIPFPSSPPPTPPHHAHHHHYHGKAAHGHCPPDRMIISGPHGPIIVAAVPIHTHGAHGMHPHPGPSRTPRPPPTSILHLHHASLCRLDVLDHRSVEPLPFRLGVGLSGFRMVIALLLVSYRAIRSRSSRPVEQQRQEADYYANTRHYQGRVMRSEEDAEDTLVPPPQPGSGSRPGYATPPHRLW
jgi:hypothetical protein